MNPKSYLYRLFWIRLSTRRRNSLIVLCLLLLSTRLSAQIRPIHGTVVSQLSGEKMAFASLSWKKAGTGCVSDSIGG
ncbi:MAG TPA: hypothetical protein VII28_08625, partial [Puia sp.]